MQDYEIKELFIDAVGFSAEWIGGLLKQA